MKKMSREGLLEELKDCHGIRIPDIKQASFKEYMRQKEAKFVGVETVGKVYYSKAPASLGPAVLYWICDTMGRPDPANKMLLDFVDLYGDIIWNDGEISIDFPFPREERALESFVKTSNSLLTAFEKEHATEITEYEVKTRKSETVLETFFAGKAKNNEGEAE